jgi:drug/metabolite transporter (DMT)-like permease
MSTWQLPSSILALVVVTVIGDYFLKMASLQTQFIQNRWFVAACMAYAMTTFAWVYIFRHMKLAAIGAIYSLLTIAILAALGFFCFGETLNRREIAGLIFAVIAIALLWRVA